MSPLLIRPQDWPVAVAALLCAVMIVGTMATHVAAPALLGEEPQPAEPEVPPAKPGVAYAPAPGRDDRTPVEFMDQVFALDDPAIADKLTGVGPVFWTTGRGSGALIAPDVVLTTAHLFVKDGTWKGGSTLLPIPPDPSQGSIYLAACGRSYPFSLIDVGDEAPRRQLGIDYAIARLKEPACDAAAILKPAVLSADEIAALTGVSSAIVKIGAYKSDDLDRWAKHPLMTGKEVRTDGLHRFHVFGVACTLVGVRDTGPHHRGSTSLFESEGCDGVPGGSGGPLLFSRDGGKSYEIIGVANSYRPNTEYNNFTRIEGAVAAHLAQFLPAGALRMPETGSATDYPASTLAPGPWLAMENRQ
ncbi:MAG: hypothetical protein AAF675_21420 [Pseudomonadota bacterium]